MQDATITVPAIVTSFEMEMVRDTFVSRLSEAKISGREYAAHLLAYFDGLGYGFAWLTMAHDAKGEDADAMRAERDTLYKALREAGHSNPSVKWKQVKGYALELLKQQQREESGEPEAEAESEGNGKRENRSVQLRYVEELTSLYKMGKREKDNLTEKQAKAHTCVAAALAELGVDIAQL